MTLAEHLPLYRVTLWAPNPVGFGVGGSGEERRCREQLMAVVAIAKSGDP